MDLFGPSRTQSLGEKSYAFMIMDDYSRFTWIIFLASKKKILSSFQSLHNVFKTKKDTPSPKSEVTMVVNFLMKVLLNFVMIMVLSKKFLLLKLLNKMV